MDIAWSNAAIMAVGALVFGVARRAEAAVFCGHSAVSVGEVGRVLGMSEPPRGHQQSARQPGAHPTAKVGEVADGALGARITSRLSGQIVTPQAAAHARQRVASRQGKLLHLTVALAAANIAQRMRAVVELHRRVSENHAWHHSGLCAAPTHMAVLASAVSVGPGCGRAELAMHAAVTAIANLRLREQPIGCLRAGAGGRMAVQAFQAADRMHRMVEPQWD